MNLKKNDVIDIDIMDMSESGEGIGKYTKIAVFVDGAVIGDKVKVKIIKVTRKYVVGKILEYLNLSDMRVKPICPIADKCGGCQMQHIRYKNQLQIKENRVIQNLKRIGDIDVVKYENGKELEGAIFYPILGMEKPYMYRNKAVFPIGEKDGKVVMGCFKKRSHDIVDTDICVIQEPVTEEIIKIVREVIEDNNISVYDEGTQKGLVRKLMIRNGKKTGEVMVCLVINGTKLPNFSGLAQRLRKVTEVTSLVLNVNMMRSNRILGSKNIVLWGKDHINDYIGDIKYKISPLSFFQVNSVQTEILYKKTLEFADLKGDEIVWDAYCGTGSISLFLAQKAKKVYGVELVKSAIRDADFNAKLNYINNVEFYTGKAEEVIPMHYEKTNIKADVIVVDPPRKGCDQKLLDTILEVKPEKVIYVSCNPATLARDLKILSTGYKPTKIQPVDMFPHTMHVETVVKLEKV